MTAADRCEDARAWKRALGELPIPKGVYRFHTHEEADQWLWQRLTSPSLNPDECRAPTLEDVVRLCRALNKSGAKYIVIGGFAILAAGFLRNTMDIDLFGHE